MTEPIPREEFQRVFDDHEARIMLPRHWTRMGAARRGRKINGQSIATVQARVHRLGRFDFRAVPYVAGKEYDW